MTLSWLDLIGYLAALLVFCTFYTKTMIPLRVVAILSNLAFMGYGFAGRLYPVLILHALLLPLNCVRLLPIGMSTGLVAARCPICSNRSMASVPLRLSQ